MLRRAIASGNFRVVVPVQHVAFAVAVAWEGPSESEGPNVSTVSDIWISEVLVLQKDVRNASEHPKNASNTEERLTAPTRTEITARALGVKLNNGDRPSDRPSDAPISGPGPSFDAPPTRLRASTASTVSLSNEQLHELPKNEFTTSVQMHVQVENEVNEVDISSRTVEPSFQKVFADAGSAGAAGAGSAIGAHKSFASTPEISNVSIDKAWVREDPHFLSPWPRRSELGMPLKTCFGALLAAVLLVLKFNKFAIFQCCKGHLCAARDLEYNYDRLDTGRQEDAETWWEEPRDFHGELPRVDSAPVRASSRRPSGSATSATDTSAASACQESAGSSQTSQSQQRSLSPNALSVSDRTVSEPEQEPHDEPLSESIDPLSTLPSTTVSEAGFAGKVCGHREPPHSGFRMMFFDVLCHFLSLWFWVLSCPHNTLSHSTS